MEQRYFERLSVPVQASIRFKTHSIDNLTAGNCSFGGMLLEANTIGIWGNDIATLNDIVTLNVTMLSQKFQMRGVVVHVSEQGIGIMLLELNINYYNLLLSQLSGEIREQYA
jgi:hypothetical protein